MLTTKDSLNSALGSNKLTSNPQLNLPKSPSLSGGQNSLPGQLPGSSLSSNLLNKLSAPSNKLLNSDDRSSNINSSSEQDTSKKSKIRPNLLSKYSSSNYIIKMQATSKEGSNRLFATRTYNAKDWITIINSAGGQGGVSKTNKNDAVVSTEGTALTEDYIGKDYKEDDTIWFTKEYYIDNVSFQSIVGSNSASRASIVCELNFEIHEPYGINFLKELWDFNSTGLGTQNYLNTCYMLTIEWKGYLDDGSLDKDNKFSKYIPFKIVDIEIQLTSLGSKYIIKAVPYDLIGKTQLYGFIPSGFEIKGQTLKELVENFKEILNSVIVQSAIDNYAPEDSSKVVPGVLYDFEFKSLKLSTGQTVKIDLSNLSSEQEIDSINKPIDTKLSKNIQEDLSKNLQSFSMLLNQKIPKGQKVSFRGQEQIIEALSQMIIMSDYVTDQIREFKKEYSEILNSGGSVQQKAKQIKEKFSNKPIYWFKIIPRVVYLGDWNEFTNSYVPVIRYDIIPYVIYDSRNSNNFIGGGLPKQNKILKEYFYFFTGKNTEVLNCDIKFNTMYFNYHQANINKLTQANGNKPTQPIKEGMQFTRPQDLAPGVTDPLSAAAQVAIPSMITRPVTNIGSSTPERIKAAEFSSILYSTTDMITVELEIMGDPDLIMQDAIMYDIKEMLEKQDEDGYTGSIVFTQEEQFVRLTFKSPADIDLKTGLPDSNFDSIFDGIYRIISISSILNQGKFTQTLTLAKVAMNDPAVPLEKRLTPASASDNINDFRIIPRV